jgi:hypothetical protein
MQPDK